MAGGAQKFIIGLYALRLLEDVLKLQKENHLLQLLNGVLHKKSQSNSYNGFLINKSWLETNIYLSDIRQDK